MRSVMWLMADLPPIFSVLPRERDEAPAGAGASSGMSPYPLWVPPIAGDSPGSCPVGRIARTIIEELVAHPLLADGLFR